MGELISSLLASLGIASAEKAAERLGSLLAEDAIRNRPALRAETERRYAAYLSALDARVSRLEQEIGPTVRDGLANRLDDPGFILLLNASSQAAIAIADDEQHEVLAALVIQCGLLQGRNTRVLAAETAARLIHQINVSHLAVLGMKYLYQRQRPWLTDENFRSEPGDTIERYIKNALIKYEKYGQISDSRDVCYLASLGLLSLGGSGGRKVEMVTALWMDLVDPLPRDERPCDQSITNSDWFVDLMSRLGEPLIGSEITETGAIIGQYFHTEVVSR